MEQHINTQVTTICLNMIVKNESHIIIKTLENLCNYFDFSYWVISDTGSTDNTKELITDFFKNKQVDGELVEHEWVDFGYNRTKALECAYNKTDLLFIFDADDEIVGDFVLPDDVCNCDRYTCKFGVDFVYYRPLLINNRKKWCFKGVLHEFLVNIDEVQGGKNIEGNYHFVSGRSGNRSKNPNKYRDDAIILKKAHLDEVEKDYGLSCRYAFYCAQSYKDAGSEYINDAIEWYKKCLDLKMWDQEKYHSCLTIGDLYMRQNDKENALKYWYKTIEYDSERIEGIINAVNHLRNDGQNLLVNALYYKFKNYKKNFELQNKLFLFKSMYNNELEYNNTISAYYVNDKISGYECSKIIFINKILPYNLLKLTVSNFKFYMDLIDKDTNEGALQLFYAFDEVLHMISLKNEQIDDNMVSIWTKLFEKVRGSLTKFYYYSFENKEKPQIFISFTTCKRLDLFKQTVYSMLNHWLDINKIDYWFCVDDNSSDEDRLEMKSRFPWINYYMKSQEEKGHRQSMNIIWNKLNELKPTYWIHMEDDFLFYNKMNYIEDAINALNELNELNVKQILFNRNYGETIQNYNTHGHVVNMDDKINNKFVLHNHSTGKFNYPNCHYWPHYSFRPSLVDAKVILELGNYDSSNQFFEMDYAKKWTDTGFKSAFFNKITNRHIGRLTNDRNTKVVKNAYDLNNEDQFNNCTEKDKDENKDKNKDKEPTSSKAFIKIVNLERRKDRKDNMTDLLKKLNIDNEEYEFIKAVDGNALEPTQELYNLFKGNDFGSRKGVIGCALSHYQLWKQLLNDKDHSFYLIMEDDIECCNDFKTKMQELMPNFVSNEILYLGYSMFKKNRDKMKHIYDVSAEITNVMPLDKTLYIGGTFSYSINKIGAKILTEYIQKNGIKHGIDYVMKIIPLLNSYECQPHLTFSEWNESGQNIDSDIQNIYDGLNFTNIEENIYKNNLEEYFVFIPNLDQGGNDLYFKKKSLSELATIALQDKNCVGFNTLGFFKNRIDELTSSKYFKEGDGMYIKKSVYEEYLNKKQEETKIIDTNCIRIKMLCNWCSSEQLCKEWSNMCENEFKWKNYELVWTNVKEDIDYYVIINRPLNDDYFDPKRTIVFQMEPWVNDTNKPWGVKTWGKWADPDPNDFLAVRGRKTNCHNNAFWQLELKLNDFQKPELFEKTKGKTISSICSSKYFDEGHIARIDFLKFLEAKGDLKLDIYNKDNNHCFTNYRGPLSPYVDKSKGISSYKYYFMMENNYETDFITEKIWEPILCETLVFYYGCPNVSDYINPNAFVLLDITDFEKSYQIIKQALSEDWWSQRIDIIRQEKQKILNKLAFFPTIDKIITKNELTTKNEFSDIYNKYFSKYNFDLDTNPKKICFIHSCYLKEVGTNILSNIISNFINTNIIQHFKQIFIVNIGEKLDQNDFQNNKIQIINYSNNSLLFEIPTINLIRVFCEYNDNCEILYLHTKGITSFNNKNISDWRNMMIHFLVNKCSDCFQKLKEYDTIGCNYQNTPYQHYSGNFWWANSNYIKRLNKIKDGYKRHDAEWWILSDKLVKYYEMHHSDIDHYNNSYPVEKYI